MCVYAECWNVDETASLLGVWSYGNMKKKYMYRRLFT